MSASHRRLFPLFGAAAVAIVGMFPPAPAVAQDRWEGAYLAAQHAFTRNDYLNAAAEFARLLELDPTAPVSREQAVVANLAIGDFGAAILNARQMQMKGMTGEAAQLALFLERIARQDHKLVVDFIESGRGGGPLVDGLSMGWALLGQGRLDVALQAFDHVGQQGARGLADYNAALALAADGQFDRAERAMAGDGTPLHFTRRAIIAHVQMLSQLGRRDDALELLRERFAADAPADIEVLRRALNAGATLPFDIVRTPREGVAEVFFDVAGALEGELAQQDLLIYLRAAEYLRPDHVDATISAARLLSSLGQHALAEQSYQRVPQGHPLYHTAELGRAEALYDSGAVEAALDVLAALADSHDALAEVHVTTGDLLRREERFGEAAEAYDRALARIAEPDQRHWSIYYTRGISHEREGAWELAEADFRKALELQPDQPHVLNYLGYSLVELDRNLDEALDMIERAVTARPDDGYITDSMGWVLFKLGRYDEAVTYMERAAELMPNDPIVNDHLGDVYWAVGRRMEARFQWRRALSFDPEPEEAERIRRKLDVGLDAVLREETQEQPSWRGASSGG